MATAEQLAEDEDEDVVVPLRHPGRWVAIAVLAVLLAMLVKSVITNPGFEWSVVREYIVSPPVLRGVANTLLLTVVSMGVAIVLGIALALMRLSPNPIIRSASAVYTWLFRGTPVLVQLLFWYYMAALFPTMSIGIPFGPAFATVSTNVLINQFTAAVLGLGLHEAAYMGEIIRGGILSVDEGQVRAGEALGLPRRTIVRRIVLPQAMRVIIPPTGNETIGLLKGSAQVVVIAYSELLTSVTLIYSRTFQTIPLLIVASIWYLAITSILTLIQRRIERHFGRGFGSPGGSGSRRSVLLRTGRAPKSTSRTRWEADDG